MKKIKVNLKNIIAGGLAAFTLANFPVPASASNIEKSDLGKVLKNDSEQTISANMDLTDLFVKGDNNTYQYETAETLANTLENANNGMQKKNADVIYDLGTNGWNPSSVNEEEINYSFDPGQDNILLSPTSQTIKFDDDSTLSSLSFKSDPDNGDLNQTLTFFTGSTKSIDSLFVSIQQRNNQVSIHGPYTSDFYSSPELSEENINELVVALKKAFLKQADMTEILQMPAFDCLETDENYSKYIEDNYGTPVTITSANGQHNITSNIDLSDLFLTGNMTFSKDQFNQIEKALGKNDTTTKEQNKSIIYALGTNGIMPSDISGDGIKYKSVSNQLFDYVWLMPDSQIVSTIKDHYYASLASFGIQSADWKFLDLSVIDGNHKHLAIHFAMKDSQNSYISFNNGTESEKNSSQFDLPTENLDSIIKSLKVAFLKQLSVPEILELPAFNFLEDTKEYSDLVQSYSKGKINQNVKKYSKTTNIPTRL